LKNGYLILFILSCFFYSCKSEQKPPVKKTPNIVLIVADDLGYTDIGCFGSEIATPHLDALAEQGQLFSSFYTSATCSPTRAMLLTGTDNHIAGLGNMAERSVDIVAQRGKPGYEGYLNDHVVSVSQLLKDAGYHTYIAGKWHLGLTPEQSPAAKGFERSFSLMEAYASHYYPDKRSNSFWEDDHFANYPAGKYSTDLYTDKLIQFIKEDQDDKKPFFLYAAYTSPHWPLQAPQEFIDKYQGRYNIGYDSLRKLRFHRLKEKGIINKQVALPSLPAMKGYLFGISDEPLIPWNALNKDEQQIESRKMEIYAAMVDNLDYNIGRLIQYLKEIGEYENTLFVFISDNGASELEANNTPDERDPYRFMGTANSFVAYGPQWAHASSAVNKLYKGYVAEGGIHSPMIIKMPSQQKGKGLNSSFTTVMDIAPTLLELAEVTYPASYNGLPLAPYQGESVLPLLKGEKDRVHDENYVMGWELFDRCAVRKGDWKILKIESPFGKGRFELYNIANDPTESNDVAEKYPDKYQEMLAHWTSYVKDNGVIFSNE